MSLDTFAFLEHFPIHTGSTPPLTPQTKLDVQMFSEFQLCIGWVGGGKGEQQENFKKDALFYEGTQK